MKLKSMEKVNIKISIDADANLSSWSYRKTNNFINKMYRQCVDLT